MAKRRNKRASVRRTHGGEAEPPAARGLAIFGRTGPVGWTTDDGGGHFRPTGERLTSAPPGYSREKAKLSARLVVRLRRGQSLESLRRALSVVREAQGREASVPVVERGLFAHHPRGGRSVRHPGAQVLLVNLEGVSARTFRREAVVAAEHLAARVPGRVVVLELQERGLERGLFLVTPVTARYYDAPSALNLMPPRRKKPKLPKKR